MKEPNKQGNSFIVAEDNFVINMFLETVLIEEGHQVLATVNSGEAVLSAVATTAPDCVLMDIGLSGRMNGVEAALLLRQEYNIPVIFLTGNSDILRRDSRIKDIQPLATWLKPIDDQFMLRELQRLFRQTS
ncbi:MAG: response regulator [Candidatus Sericytochromatia bacterium]|nr:response regulator [Candidatus Sericytochromatia bacterium]